MDINTENMALGIQTRLLKTFINLVRSSDQEGMLKATLQKTVDLAVEITGAEAGSLFLIDNAGVVTDRIVIRETTSRFGGGAKFFYPISPFTENTCTRPDTSAAIATESSRAMSHAITALEAANENSSSPPCTRSQQEPPP